MIEGQEYNGMFQSVEDDKVVIVVDKDEKAHKVAEKAKNGPRFLEV